MVTPHGTRAFWAGTDRIMSHVVHAFAGLAGDSAVFKGGSHLRLCVIETEDLPRFRFSEDLDFEWDGPDWVFWDMFDKALAVAGETSGYELGWGQREDRFWWQTSTPAVGGHIKIDYRQRGSHQVGWYSVWNPDNDAVLTPTPILGFTPESITYDKISTLAATGRVKARDVFDLWFLSHYDYVNLTDMWKLWHRREQTWNLEELWDEIVTNQLDYYLHSWQEGLTRGIYPQEGNGDLFQQLLLTVFEKMSGQ